MSKLIALEIANELDLESGIVCREAAEAIREQHAEIERLTAERDIAEKCCSMLARINNGIILAMQAAWIAHEYGKEPTDSVMEWIANSLEGPGLLPCPDDEGFTTDAQAWFDAQIDATEDSSTGIKK